MVNSLVNKLGVLVWCELYVRNIVMRPNIDNGLCYQCTLMLKCCQILISKYYLYMIYIYQLSETKYILKLKLLSF